MTCPRSLLEAPRIGSKLPLDRISILIDSAQAVKALVERPKKPERPQPWGDEGMCGHKEVFGTKKPSQNLKFSSHTCGEKIPCSFSTAGALSSTSLPKHAEGDGWTREGCKGDPSVQGIQGRNPRGGAGLC